MATRLSICRLEVDKVGDVAFAVIGREGDELPSRDVWRAQWGAADPGGAIAPLTAEVGGPPLSFAQDDGCVFHGDGLLHARAVLFGLNPAISCPWRANA